MEHLDPTIQWAIAKVNTGILQYSKVLISGADSEMIADTHQSFCEEILQDPGIAGLFRHLDKLGSGLGEWTARNGAHQRLQEHRRRLLWTLDPEAATERSLILMNEIRASFRALEPSGR